jgi:hypothetical protein
VFVEVGCQQDGVEDVGSTAAVQVCVSIPSLVACQRLGEECACGLYVRARALLWASSSTSFTVIGTERLVLAVSIFTICLSLSTIRFSDLIALASSRSTMKSFFTFILRVNEETSSA